MLKDTILSEVKLLLSGFGHGWPASLQVNASGEPQFSSSAVASTCSLKIVKNVSWFSFFAKVSSCFCHRVFQEHFLCERRYFYRAFHKTLDEQIPKFVRNFRSWRQIWQLDYVVADQTANFKTKLRTYFGTSTRQNLSLWRQFIHWRRKYYIHVSFYPSTVRRPLARR